VPKLEAWLVESDWQICRFDEHRALGHGQQSGGNASPRRQAGFGLSCQFSAFRKAKKEAESDRKEHNGQHSLAEEGYGRSARKRQDEAKDVGSGEQRYSRILLECNESSHAGPNVRVTGDLRQEAAKRPDAARRPCRLACYAGRTT